ERAIDGSARATLAVLLGVGLGLRLLILTGTGGMGLEIVDEQHYHQLAASLSEGHGFAWAPGRMTSARPPLYPAFIAAVWQLTGRHDLQVVRLAQIVLSLITAIVLYVLARGLYDRRVAILTTAGFLFYPSLIAYDYLLLTETLFTLILCLFVL